MGDSRIVLRIPFFKTVAVYSLESAVVGRINFNNYKAEQEKVNISMSGGLLLEANQLL